MLSLGSKDMNFPSQYAQPFIVQCIVFLWKKHMSYWMNPHYIFICSLFTKVVSISDYILEGRHEHV
jgi:hypothetical protein